MTWNTICVEGFCFADYVDGEYPCGKPSPSTFCLRNHMCPHFAWGESSERETAYFVPLHLLVWDRVRIWWTEEFLFKLRWWFWDKWHYDKDWYRKIKSLEPDDPVAIKLNRELEEQVSKFSEWFEEARKEGGAS